MSLLSWRSSEPSLALSFSKSIFSLNCSARSQFSTFPPPKPHFFILVKPLSALFAPLRLSSFFPSITLQHTDRQNSTKIAEPTVCRVEATGGGLTYSMRSHLTHSLYCRLDREQGLVMAEPCCVFAGIRRSHVTEPEKSSTVSHTHEKQVLLPARTTSRRPIRLQTPLS